MTIRRICHVAVFAASLSFAGLVLAEAASGTVSQSHESIRALAADFARQQFDDSGLRIIDVKASALDPRLNLASCDEPLEAFSNGNARQLARATVGVRCAGEKPWTLYVPVTVEALANVVFTSKPLLRGEAIGPDSLELREVPLAKLPFNHLSETTQLAGMEAARSLQAGVPLTLNAVRPEQLIKQGQEVIIVASNGGIRVHMAGKALRSGSRGDLIPVQNTRSGRTVEAEVLDAGTVKVKF